MRSTRSVFGITALFFGLCFGSTSCTTLQKITGTAPSETETPPQMTSALGKSNTISLVVGGTGVASYATVGMLKKFNEEGIQVEFIITTGWTTPFVLANGFMKSVHDLEWFATRLGENDFEKMGEVDFRREIDPTEVLPSIIVQSFPQTLLNQARVPVIISATNTDLGEPDVFGSGEWKEPLLRTVSVPGIYRKFPTDRGTGWIEGLSALDVREAIRRGASVVVAVSMYDDYLQELVAKKSGGNDEELMRRVYAAQLRKSIQEAGKQATLSSSIAIKKAARDFSAKRTAILAGYREAARIVKKLREPASAAN